ncbi:metal ABC transporter solute-binding protein, Zn/Mn family [Algoriphagus sediminis]|uniref:Zinc ABC transporter substrate-binding protein n=1 Tax=Algoriphagus sediminis TaxID=3057113 RepID=A0ABT7YCW1_9BACT|nr:zinc ABC transporter substrate-binding protein [Algoriphagus sediminis]MDN3204354.1 zinc ABC transporter substrate-binding protein [Algoriphagus sediminis]
MKKLWLIISILFVSSCKFESTEERSKPLIVVTTSILQDGVNQLVGDLAEVVSLMPAGVDPHLYKASVRDLDLLQNADLVVYHGLFLEGKMTEIFEKLKIQKDLINASAGIAQAELIKNGPEAHAVDPHIWFDVELWAKAMNHVSEKLILWRPDWSSEIESRNTAYQVELSKLDQEISQKAQKLKESNQALITAHDAFAYFGKAYGLEVLGLQGLSTLSEPGLRDLTGLVNFIVQNDIKAVFAEQTISPKAIEAVVAGCTNQNHKIKLAGPLYTDSLDSPGTDAGTYVGMVKTNLDIIYNSLIQ